jgi:hypothetical protein
MACIKRICVNVGEPYGPSQEVSKDKCNSEEFEKAIKAVRWTVVPMNPVTMEEGRVLGNINRSRGDVSWNNRTNQRRTRN